MLQFEKLRRSLTLLAVALAIPVATVAQTGSIAGEVADETGGVLPGVTVEATSEELIGGARVTVTDGSGLYTIEALVPGTYTVTFTLPGFSTFVRDGVELQTGFTANVDGQLAVGSIEETITVSGAAPIIDVQNVVTQENLTRDALDVLPTGKTYWGYAALTVGMTTNIAGGGHDVGGSVGEGWGHVEIHGSSASDGSVEWDGMSINNNITDGGGSSKQFFMNQAAIQEIVVSTANMSSEQPYGGVGINAIPKEGGNTFSYYVNVSGTNGDLQAANVDDTLVTRGVNPKAKNKKIWDYSVGIGGPIVNDKVWFYTAHRWWGAQNYQAKTNYNLTPHTPFYTPDMDRPTWTDFWNQDNGIRFTYQASDRHKLTLGQNFQSNCACHFWTQYGVADNDAAVDYTYYPINLTQATWTFPVNNSLLIEAGGSFLRNLTSPRPQESVLPTDIAHFNFVPFVNYQAIGFNTCNPCLYGNEHDFPTQVYRGSVSYVTGTHNFKVGFNTRNAQETHGVSYMNNPLRYNFYMQKSYGGAMDYPFSVTQYGTPRTSRHTSNDLGIYAQDQWTLDRLTLNIGVRYDHVNAYYPDQSHPGDTALRFFGADATRFVPAFDVAGRENVPNYHDIVPRMGAAYDLSGDGRTAIKATWGKYVLPVGTSIAEETNPLNALQLETTRLWRDLAWQGGNGNMVPDCDFNNFAANGECGAVDNPQFGSTESTVRFDPNVLTGWGKRQYQWQASLSLQQEIVEGWSVDVGYFRTWYKNHLVADNLLIGPEDFDAYSIVAPTDPRLGDYSGKTLDGLYTITPAAAALGQDAIVKLASDYPGGDQMGQWFNGVDVNFNGRFDNGFILAGGMSTGSLSFNECFIVDSPQRARPGYCDVKTPWMSGTQFKVNGAMPLPYDTQISFVFQNLAGLPWESIYGVGQDPAERAAVEAQLGRPMAVTQEDIDIFPSGSGTADVTLSSLFNFTGSQLYEDRLTQLDLRFTKIINVGGARFRAWFDVFNIFNHVAVTNLVDRYSSPDLPYPGAAQVMGGRLFKFGGQFDF